MELGSLSEQAERWMERIMNTDRELTEIELDAVSGGDLSIQKHLDQASSSVGGGDGGSPTPTSAWNTLLYQYGYIK
jgi:hypothetical protein